MTLSDSALAAVDQHWAVTAIPETDRVRADDLVREQLARRAVGGGSGVSFEGTSADEFLLEKVALAYEIAAIEGLKELGCPTGGNPEIRSQTMAAAHRTFGIRRLLPVPKNTCDRMYFVLHLSAFAICGERWSDLRCWYKEQEKALAVPGIAGAEWDHGLLCCLFDCWIRLFRNEARGDLDRVCRIIAGLRKDRKLHGKRCLQDSSQTANRLNAFRLVAFYNWAKATETVATYMLRGEPADPFGVLDKHFEAAIQAAAASEDIQCEVAIRWLHPASRIMVAGSQTGEW